MAWAGLPPAVTDLTVSAATDSSLTVGFTQISDGTSGSANYDIRLAATPISWGSATPVTHGSCASPFMGGPAGTRTTCTITGLNRATSYEVQLVAFRGTLDDNAVFGPLSNVASGATVAALPAIASVTVSPASATDTLGKAVQFQATVLDASGNTLIGQAITWSSSDTTVIRVGASGTANTVAPGSATVTATTGGKSGSGSVTVVATAPATVTDLTVSRVTDTSMTLTFTEVGGGTGQPANYDLRYAVRPLTWWLASPASAGSCIAPLTGIATGSPRSCTITGLASSTTYDVQLVAFRGTLNVNAVFGALSNVASGTTSAAAVASAASECSSPRPEWIWCDDFELDRTSRYFEYDSNGGNFVRAAGAGVNGSAGMSALYLVGRSNAGSLHLAFGRTPASVIRPVDAGTANYREVYWRVYVRNQPGWTGGGGDKLSRAFVFANSSWAQAAIGHIWSGYNGTPASQYLVEDPASGTDASGNLLTTGYNDFAHLSWLGARQGATPLYDAAHVGQWYCVEAHMRLNSSGASDGVLEFWINGGLEAQRTGLNFLGSFSAYGINALYLENYWNVGPPVNQTRYLDNFVVSTARIGCLS